MLRSGKIDMGVYIGLGHQTKTLRMIIEDQNASYRFAAKMAGIGGETTAKIFFRPEPVESRR
jgi:hypothetical protein